MVGCVLLTEFLRISFRKVYLDLHVIFTVLYSDASYETQEIVARDESGSPDNKRYI